MTLISKSKIKQNKQCSKQLWLEINKPKEKIISESSLKSFSIGKDVEKLAKSQFKGKDVISFKNIDKLIETNKYLTSFNTIYEAAFEFDSFFVQVDILNKVGKDLYDIIEVKSGTKITPDNLDDITIQYFVIEQSKKVNINKYYIWHVNKESKGLDDFFSKIDVTDQIKTRFDEFKKWADDAKKTINYQFEIEKEIGTHCNNPYECSFKNYCWKSAITDTQSVLNLPRFSKKWESYKSGIKKVSDPLFKEKYSEYIDKNKIIYESVLTNKLIRNESNILKGISNLTFPVFFLDFESLMTPIPFLKEQKPYQQTVFQFSIHELDENLNLNHYEYLKKEDTFDEIPDLLLSIFKEKGSIVVFNKTFEITRIKEYILKYPDKKLEFENLVQRIYDFAELFEENVYHPKLMGSFSLKRISDVIFENIPKYNSLNVKNGSEVSDVFISFFKESDLTKKAKLEKDLKDYNKLDTLNLVFLYFWFKDLSNFDNIVKKFI